MRAEKDPKTGKWLIQYRYTDWQGKRRKSTKRGFTTKREAEAWLRSFLQKNAGDFDMKFDDFIDLYLRDMESRLRENTLRTKKYIIDLKLRPYFGSRNINEITVADIRKWHTHLIQSGYSPTYLRTISNQLAAIFNYATRYYDLKVNPCAKAGTIGKGRADEMNFWTQEEFEQFIVCVMDKQDSYTGFMILFWTGIRISELLALTPADICIQKQTISITKGYHRLDGQDIITPPKTPKSKRLVTIPEFLAADLKDYMDRIYEIGPRDRIFFHTKHFYEKELRRGIAASGVKPVRLHDLRHSHASLLVSMGFSPLEIADRLGHEKVETTLNTYAHLYPNTQAALAARLQLEYEENL